MGTATGAVGETGKAATSRAVPARSTGTALATTRRRSMMGAVVQAAAAKADHATKANAATGRDSSVARLIMKADFPSAAMAMATTRSLQACAGAVGIASLASDSDSSQNGGTTLLFGSRAIVYASIRVCLLTHGVTLPT